MSCHTPRVRLRPHFARRPAVARPCPRRAESVTVDLAAIASDDGETEVDTCVEDVDPEA